MSDRESLLSFLFDRTDKKILNVKFFRGNARDLTVDQLCKTAMEVIKDTWDREGEINDFPPTSRSRQIEISSLK